jgi:hypothetical protein
MLVLLAERLEQYARAFNVFGYITLRAVLATMTALVISFGVGPRMIAWLARMKIGQSVRDDGPQTHLIKAGTPTMGGALILVSIAVTTLLWGNLTNRFVWVVLLVTVGFGAIGWVDDWRKVVRRNPKGLSVRTKFFWQSLIGLIAAIYLAFSVSAPTTRSSSSSCPLDRQRLQCRPVAEGQPHRAFLQDGVLSPGRLGVHCAHLLRDRRHQQRGQPDRRPRRTRDHADGHGRRRVGNLRLRDEPRGLLELSVFAAYSRRGRTHGHLRRDRWRGFGLPVVQRVSADGSWHGCIGAGCSAGHHRRHRRAGNVLFVMGGVFVVETLS